MNNDLELYSVRADIWQDTEPHRRQVAISARFDQFEQEFAELCERYEGMRTDLELSDGMLVQKKLGPLTGAAYGAWLRDREAPRRIELTELSEAPIPPDAG
jgi:hypothetical protein